MRIISEGQAIELLHAFFGLDMVPVAFEDVKKEYREKSKRLHPDARGPESSEEGFKKLGSAFDDLKQLYQVGSRLFDAGSLC